MGNEWQKAGEGGVQGRILTIPPPLTDASRRPFGWLGCYVSDPRCAEPGPRTFPHSPPSPRGTEVLSAEHPTVAGRSMLLSRGGGAGFGGRMQGPTNERLDFGYMECGVNAAKGGRKLETDGGVVGLITLAIGKGPMKRGERAYGIQS